MPGALGNCGARAMGPPLRAGVSCRGGCGSSRLLAWCFLLALSPQAPGSRGAEAVWTAYLNVSWRVPHTGVNRTVWELSEEGVYGQDSPLEPVSGVLVPPDGPGALNACNPHTNFTVPTVWGSTVQVSWLALIQRGGAAPSQTRFIWLMREGRLEPSSLTSPGPAMRSSPCLTRVQETLLQS